MACACAGKARSHAHARQHLDERKERRTAGAGSWRQKPDQASQQPASAEAAPAEALPAASQYKLSTADHDAPKPEQNAVSSDVGRPPGL